MEAVLPGLIIIALLMLVMLSIAYDYLSSQETTTDSWREMEERLGDKARTDLTPLDAETDVDGDIVEVTLRNDGGTKLSDFGQWDVIVQYQATGLGYLVDWLPYNEIAGDRWWRVEGIYQDAAAAIPEAFDPDIVNPGEQVVVQIWLNPSIASGSTNLATVVTPNGITASTVFTYAGS